MSSGALWQQHAAAGRELLRALPGGLLLPPRQPVLAAGAVPRWAGVPAGVCAARGLRAGPVVRGRRSWAGCREGLWAMRHWALLPPAPLHPPQHYLPAQCP